MNVQELLANAGQGLLENLAEGVIVTDLDGQILYCNPAARGLCGAVQVPASLTSLFASQADESWRRLLAAPAEARLTVGAGPLVFHSAHVDTPDGAYLQLVIGPDTAAEEASASAAAQLAALDRVSHALNATLQLDQILSLALAEAVRHCHAVGGEIALWDEAGDAFETIVQKGRTITVEPALLGRTMSETQLSVVSLPEPADGCRSMLLAPVLYEGLVAGLITLFAAETAHFSSQHRTFVSSLAHHVAIAIGQEQRNDELRQRTELFQGRARQIERFVEAGRALQSDRPLAEVYEELVHAIQESVGYKVVLLSLVEPGSAPAELRRIAAAGLPLERLRMLQSTVHTWDDIAPLMDEQFALGGAYFAPQEATVLSATSGVAFHNVADLYPPEENAAERKRRWQAGDLFFIPMRDSMGEPLGVISVDVPENGLRPDVSVARALEIFAHQAATAVENNRLFHNAILYTERLQQLHDISREILREPHFERQLELLVDGLQKVGWERVILSLRDSHLNPIRLVTAGLDDTEREHLWANMVAPEVWQERLSNEKLLRFQQASCYFLPADDPWVQEYLGRILAPEETSDATHPNRWRPHDLLFMPIYDRQQQVMAIIGLDAPVSRRRPDARMMQTLELYAQFATAVLENAQLLSQTLARSQELRNLFDAGRAISSTLEPDRVLMAMGDHMLAAVGGDSYAIYQWQPHLGQLRLLLARPSDAATTTVGAGPPADLDPTTAVYAVLADESPEIVDGATALVALPGVTSWLDTSDATSVALLPLVIRDEAFGVVAIARQVARERFGASELQLLSAFINQASIALENARLFEDTYQRERFYAALGRVSMAINVTLDLTTVLDLICQESQSIFRVDGVYIWERQDDLLVGQAARGIGDQTFAGATLSLENDDVFAVSVAREGHAIFANDVAGNEQSEAVLGLPVEVAPQSLLGVPLKQENEIIGVMVLVDNTTPNRFNHRDIEYATTFGVQAAIATQNARLVTQLRALNEELDQRVESRTKALADESARVRILLRISTELASSLDQDRVLNGALRLVNEAVHATQGVIMLVNPETDELIFRAAFGLDTPLPAQGRPTGMKSHEGLAGWIIENRQSAVVHDTEKDPRWITRATSSQHRSALAVPLIAGEEVIGVLMLFQQEPHAFTEEQLDLVEAAASQVASAINNASLYLLIRDQAERLGSMLREEQIETAKNEAILQSIADGVLVADTDGRIILANRPTSRILGIAQENLVGRHVDEMLGLYGASGDNWIRAIEHWAQNAANIKDHSYLADQIQIEDRVVSVHVAPVFASLYTSNRFFGTVSIFRDVTREVEVDRMKSEFVSTVSHELRTPMTSIKGYADLMLMGAAGELDDAQTRYLGVIKNNADRLHMLVNDLLDISRIETGRTELELRPLDVNQIIEQVVEGHLRGRIQHQGKYLRVVTDLSPGLPLVTGDIQRVTQVLTNLIDNAFNYTPENGTITIRTVTEGACVAISVSDTGIGIAEQHQGKIFGRFFRADEQAVQQVPGTGLGLAIVQSLVEMHGGTLRLDSEVGYGSTFTFTLLIEEEKVEAAA